MNAKRLRWSILKPLSPLHWSIPLAFIAAWLFLFVSSSCSEGPIYGAVSLLTASIATSIWVAWFNAPPSSTPVRAFKSMGVLIHDIVSFLIWISGLGLICAAFMPAYQCMTDRARVVETIALSGIYRTAVADKAHQLGKLDGIGEGMTVAPEGHLKGGTVTRNGVVILLSEEPAALIVLRPSMSAGVVEWNCSGFPSKVLPASCRTLPTFD